MPHIHTATNEHDITVSMYIIRRGDDGEWRCLVHMHRKIDKLMQVGGHIELTQTPWQAVAAELAEETGYQLSELKLFQPTKSSLAITDAVVHPVPFLINTHSVGDGHYHSDMCFGFAAAAPPAHAPHDSESQDFRWLSLRELYAEAKAGALITDVAEIYEYLLRLRSTYYAVDPGLFSLQKPKKGSTYKR